jgi:sialic acid synthase SpsE/sugar phosphate isomerase/epimerase
MMSLSSGEILSKKLDLAFRSPKLRRIFQDPHSTETYIICEVGINHGGSLPKALALIDAALEAGADAVKFQKRTLNRVYSEGVLNDSNSAEWSFDYLIPLLKECELSEADYREINRYCKERGLDLIVTPFDEAAADFIATLSVAAIKIASADLTNLNLVRHCASLCRPLIISTGMWSHDDIESCVRIFSDEQITFALLHTQSSYPAPFESINLGYLEELKKMAPIVGYSGHERGIFIPIAAVAMGCRIIEKHITFDRNDKGPDHKASMLPEEWKEMISNIRLLEKSLGFKKEVNQTEILNREVFAKSAVAVRNLKKGHILLAEDVDFRSPGKGIFPHEIDSFYGMVLKKDISRAFYIAKTDFEPEIRLTDWKKFAFSKEWGVKCRFHDFEEFKVLESPVIEFHCSQTDLGVPFSGRSKVSALVVHAPEVFDRELVDICSPSKGKVERSLSILQRSIDKTLEIAQGFPRSRPKLVMHLGGMFLDFPGDADTAELMDRAIDNFKRLNYKPDEIDILPENLPPRPWYLGGQWHQYGFMKAGDMVRFCGELGLGMVFDLCHAFLYCNLYQADLSEYTLTVLPYVKHMHISDASGISGEGLQVGDGEIDFDLCLELMKNAEFSWVPEVWSGHHHHAAGLYKALINLEAYGKGL